MGEAAPVNFEQVYDEHFSKQYGFFRPYTKEVIYRYLDCGDLHHGFARVKCPDCGYEHSPANAATSAPPAIKSGWSSLGSGSAWRS